MRLHNRQVKADFWRDTELIRALPPVGLMFYQGLWHLADDSGCLEDDPYAYKLHLFPLYEEVTIELITRWRDTLVNLGKLIRYEVKGKPYLFLKNFHRHQKLDKPAPPNEFSVPMPPWVEWQQGDSRRESRYVVRDISEINQDAPASSGDNDGKQPGAGEEPAQDVSETGREPVHDVSGNDPGQDEGIVQDLSGTRPGLVRDTSGTCPGQVQDVSGTCRGLEPRTKNLEPKNLERESTSDSTINEEVQGPPKADSRASPTPLPDLKDILDKAVLAYYRKWPEERKKFKVGGVVTTRRVFEQALTGADGDDPIDPDRLMHQIENWPDIVTATPWDVVKACRAGPWEESWADINASIAKFLAKEQKEHGSPANAIQS
ncbi:MAG: hypothetical protein HPY71_14405 [Firmicutes bacterium]|nr:hypothetical protein [Bacillota bacterium]